MDIKAGDDYLTLPEAIETHYSELCVYPKGSPEFDPQSYALAVHQISFTELMEMKAKLPEEAKITGVPRYYTVAAIEGKQRLFFWPAPAQDMFAKFRYYPAMKEI